MLRTLHIIKAVVWILILAVCCWFLFTAVTGSFTGRIFSGNFDGLWAKGELVEEEKTVDAAGLDSIEIDTASYDCIVATHDNQDIRIVRNGDKDRSLRVFASGGKLSVDSNEKGFSGFIFFWSGLSDASVTVYLPQDYDGSLSVDTASGDVKLDKLPLLESVSVDTASGSIRTQELRAGDGIAFTTASGDVTGRLFSADSVSVETASGDVDLDVLNTHNFDIKTASGNITAGSATGGGEIETSSGGITLEYAATPESDVEISTMSGDIRCKIPENADFCAEFETVSGNIDSDFAAILSGKNDANVKNGSGGAEINFSTMSGDIRLTKGPAA